MNNVIMRLNRFFLTIFGICLVEANLFAQQVSESDALQKAQAFMQGKIEAAGGSRRAPRKMQRVPKAAENDAFYIFNAEGNGGFVIVSGDERTESILGYSTEGNIDPNNMPENMQALLKSYEEQIKEIPVSARATPAMTSTHPAVEPMIKSRWGQDAPYNLECPEKIPNGKTELQHCKTGCVATAMAQIMYYYKWPQGSTTAIPAYNYGDSYCDELPPTTFDWEHMKDLYVSTSSGVSADAVAHLMRYCGQAFKMSYGLEESGTILQEFRSIYKYLGYSDKARLVNLFSFSIEEWDGIIYHEIQSGRPVLYAGSLNDDFQHAVVCDGYDGNGFYHFNFGWNGYTNYYGRLLAGPKIMASDDTQWSSANAEAPFWLYPQAVIGIQKDDNYVEELFTENVLSRFEIDNNGNNTIVCSNLTNDDLLIDAGFYCINMNNLSVEKSTVISQNDRLPFSSAAYFPVSFSPEDYAIGVRYRIVPIWKESSESEWHISDNKYSAFLEVVNGSIVVTQPKSVDYEVAIEMEGSLVDSTRYKNSINYCFITFKNHGADLIRTFYISVLDSKGNVFDKGEWNVSLSEGENGSFGLSLVDTTDSIGAYSIIVYDDYDRNHIIAKKDFKISRRMQIYSIDGEYDWKNKTVRAKISNRESSTTYNQEVRVYFIHSGEYYPYAVKSTRLNLLPKEETYVSFDCHDVPFNFTDNVRVVVNLNDNEERYPIYYNTTWDLHYTDLKSIKIYDGFYYDNAFGEYLCYVIDNEQNKCYINSIKAYQSQEIIPSKVKNPYSNKWYDVVGIPSVSYGHYFGSGRSFIHKGVENIIIEEGIETIGSNVLQDSCQNLQSIVFPSTLRYIGNFAMGKCQSLKSIYCKAKIPPIIVNNGNKNGITDKSIIQTSFIYVGNSWNEVHHEFNYDDVILYVPIGSKEAYADVWGAFVNIVEMDVEDMPLTEILLGDANGDGRISVTDVGMVISYILQKNPAGFNEDAADVNGDGRISITDVGAIITKILKGDTQPAVTYYYYAGWTQPTASNVDTIINETYPTSSSDNTQHSAGKKTTSKSSFSLASVNLYNSIAKTNYYVLVPTGQAIYDTVFGLQMGIDSFTSQGTITVGTQTHTIYKSKGTSRNITAIKIQ